MVGGWTRKKWVFGMLGVKHRGQKTKPVLRLVERRTRRELIPLVLHHVRTGSTILTDEWRAYRQALPELGYKHYTVNHSVEYASADTGCHTQHIERAWRSYKETIGRLRGNRTEDLLRNHLVMIEWNEWLVGACVSEEESEDVGASYGTENTEGMEHLPSTITCADGQTSRTQGLHAPDCWTRDQVEYFCKANDWLIVKYKKLGCRNCQEVKSLGAMNASDYESTSRVFRTAYKIAKHSRPLADLPVDLSLQQLNGVNVGRVLHSSKTCGVIIDHIADLMKDKMAKDITENNRKLCVLIDESTTISGKSVLVVCLRSALVDANPETFFCQLIELSGTTADAITKALIECLERHFTEDFLEQCLVSFACDGASVMLGKKAGVASKLCSKFPGIFVWHCLNHRLELAVGDVMKEVSGLNHFQIFFDKLYSLFLHLLWANSGTGWQ
ncbi:E3 SUMO-protein ligase KIAA1586-like [Halichoeres trimaculatus]|uniref:E3 SUMO-protein ligase KIAA1586-like n=1 Tax=Halichoeres trimaculatus TaxID=147232 RepID=UPI003D9F1714